MQVKLIVTVFAKKQLNTNDECIMWVLGFGFLWKYGQGLNGYWKQLKLVSGCWKRNIPGNG